MGVLSSGKLRHDGTVLSLSNQLRQAWGGWASVPHHSNGEGFAWGRILYPSHPSQ